MILRISAKCSDLFWAQTEDDSGNTQEYRGYVPDFMPGQHWGDYVDLVIDPETGVILNWRANAAVKAIKAGVKTWE